MNEKVIKYADILPGMVVKFYGATLRITEVTHVKKRNARLDIWQDCTYFSVEPYDDEAVRILGGFYSRGRYGGIDSLEITQIEGA